jgi:hypothetical protein
LHTQAEGWNLNIFFIWFDCFFTAVNSCSQNKAIDSFEGYWSIQMNIHNIHPPKEIFL